MLRKWSEAGKTKIPDKEGYPDRGLKKGVKLLKNRGKNILKILMNLVQPLTMEVLMEKMEFRSRSSFRDDYIKPLWDNKLIDLTIPDKPRDPGQSYIISEQGKIFLGGFEI